MPRLLGFAWIAFASSSAAAQQDLSAEARKESVTPQVAIRNSLVLKVSDRDAAADEVIARVEAAGGYFSSRTDSAVTLKVPVDASQTIIAFIESKGVVVYRDYQAKDVGYELAERRARLQSREEVLQRYFSVLRTAQVQAVVSVEREMTQLVQEIETLKGQLRLLDHRLAFAQIVVDFEFRDRRPPLRTGRSNFGWINSVNLTDLLGRFGQ